MPTLSKEILTPAVSDLLDRISGMVAKIKRGDIRTWYEMLSHPKIALAVEVRILLAIHSIEEYAHSDEALQKEIRDSISALRGNWLETIAQMLPIVAGFSFSEIAYKIKNKQATLSEIQTIDPRRVIEFSGTRREITTVLYESETEQIPLEYSQGIHLKHQSYFSPGNDPKGISPCSRAENYWLMHKVLMSVLAIASQRQATPIMYGKTNLNADNLLLNSSGEPVLNSNGEPLRKNRGEEMLEKLEDAENSSVMVIDSDDELDAIAQQTDGKLIMEAIRYVEVVLMECWLVPETITGVAGNGTGDSRLSTTHMQLLLLATKTMMKFVAEALIEGWVRRQLEFNHGELDDYGDFPIVKEDSEDVIALLNAIGNVLSKGGFSKKDLAVINRMRALAGIPTIEDIADAFLDSAVEEQGDRPNQSQNETSETDNETEDAEDDDLEKENTD